LEFYKKYGKVYIDIIFREEKMNINTGKLASSTNILFKKLKDNETTNKVSENNGSINKEKILNDFADIKFIESNFKTRIINNNARLSNYENETSKLQYVNQRLDLIQNEINSNASNVKIKELIDKSIYNNQYILKEYFKDADYKSSLHDAKNIVSDRILSLDKEFKKIEIASQNIISLNTQATGTAFDSIKNLKNENLADSTILSNKRVMQLIS
jgi:hypothetical protein